MNRVCPWALVCSPRKDHPLLPAWLHPTRPWLPARCPAWLPGMPARAASPQVTGDPGRGERLQPAGELGSGHGPGAAPAVSPLRHGQSAPSSEEGCPGISWPIQSGPRGTRSWSTDPEDPAPWRKRQSRRTQHPTVHYEAWGSFTQPGPPGATRKAAGMQEGEPQVCT